MEKTKKQLANQRYEQSEKGKATRKAYRVRTTDIHKLYEEKYRQSDKYKQTRKAYVEKNADKIKAYFKSEKAKEAQRKYREAHREEKNAYDLQRRQRLYESKLRERNNRLQQLNILTPAQVEQKRIEEQKKEPVQKTQRQIIAERMDIINRISNDFN